MQVASVCWQPRQQSFTMFLVSSVLRNLNARAVTRAGNCLLVKRSPSSADFSVSAVALLERHTDQRFEDRNRNEGSFTDRNRERQSLTDGNQNERNLKNRSGSERSLVDRNQHMPSISRTYTHLDVSAGGGPRPKKPKVWKTKLNRGSLAKSGKLLDLVKTLSNTKEEVYGALDAWIAWDLEFPLIPVKKALKTLSEEKDWRRIIQISKWMLDKGQGKTMATYQLLVEALDHEGRVEEAEIIWYKLVAANTESIPRAMFALMIGMFDRHEMPKKLLQVFAEMEEIRVKPDAYTLERVARAYAHFGHEEYGEELKKKYHDAVTLERRSSRRYSQRKFGQMKRELEKGRVTDIKSGESEPEVEALSVGKEENS